MRSGFAGNDGRSMLPIRQVPAPGNPGGAGALVIEVNMPPGNAHAPFVRQAIALAGQARSQGNHPFGALLVLDERVVLGDLVAPPLAPPLLRQLAVVYPRERMHSRVVGGFIDFAKSRLAALQAEGDPGRRVA